MQTRTTLIALLATATLATTANAESVSSGGMPDYAKLSFNYFTESNYDLFSLNGAADWRTGPLTFTLGASHFSSDGPGDLHTLTGKVAYNFGNGFAAYVQAHYFDFDFGGSETFYGIGADYQNEVFGLGAQYLSVESEDVFHLVGFYRFGPKFSAGGTTALGAVTLFDDEELISLGVDHRTERFRLTAVTTLYDGPSDGITAFGGHFYATPQIGIGANILTSNDDFLDDGIYSIDVGYRVADNLKLSAAYVSGFGNGPSGDIFGLNLTWELGRDRARVFDSVDMYMKDALGPINNLWYGDAFTQIYGPGVIGF